MSRRHLLLRLRHQVLGLAFLLVVVLFFVTTIAIYNKAFVTSTTVRLETDHVGNQMREGADVKVRGMVVGEVRTIESLGDRASVELALKPERVDVIPANVSARLLPKTLFGERYVSLQVPEKPAAEHLDAGDVIGQDRSSTAIELETVLGDVLPLLQAVQPQKLASTLNAVSTALDGRGEQLGETLSGISQYLGEMNPSLPDLKANVSALADVSGTYDKAAPDVLQALSDLTTTSKTFVAKKQGLSDLYATVSTASTDLRSFLEVNKDNLIDLTTTLQPTLDVLAKYAPEYPCLLKQLADSVPAAELAFGKGTDHPEVSRVTIELTSSRGKYIPGVDEPKMDDKRGPRCYPQTPKPNNFPQYPPDGAVKDGSSKPAPPRGTDGLPVQGSGASGGAESVSNSVEEQRLIAALRAPALGVPPEQVPGFSSLLVGPLYRGAEVTVK